MDPKTVDDTDSSLLKWTLSGLILQCSEGAIISGQNPVL